jgi:hypothetical protein
MNDTDFKDPQKASAQIGPKIKQDQTRMCNMLSHLDKSWQITATF